MNKQLTVMDDVRNNLKRMEPQFKMALPVHIKPERFLRVVTTAIQNNASLLSCDRTSLFSACTRAAQDGLLPDGKEAALVPFNNSVQYMPMVAGILKKVRNSGELKTIMAQIVYKNDEFEYWIDSDGEHLNHKPLIFGDRGEKLGGYALATTKDGGTYIEVMTAADIKKVRDVSRSKNGPWKTWPEEMEKKTFIRRLSKRLPMSTDLEEFMKVNDNMYDLGDPEPKNPEEPSRLKNIINESDTVEPAAEAIDTTAAPSTETEVPI